MGGLMSRRKGMRGEYLVRDELRKFGFHADRIPASGAAEGFKGDIRVKFDNKEVIFEVKLRKKEFTKLYDLLDSVMGLDLQIGNIRVSYEIAPMMTGALPRAFLMHRSETAKILNKCLMYRVDSDILVVKDDRRPLIYISWVGDESSIAA